MNREIAAAWLKLGALTGVVGLAFNWWLRAPVLASTGTQGWLAVALALAAMLGGTCVIVTDAWPRAIVAIAIGLILGAAWAEFWMPNDVPVSLMESVRVALSNYGREFIGPILGAAAVGAFVARCPHG